MNLQVGILGKSTVWHRLLKQEGVPFSFITEDTSDYNSCVVVASRYISTKELDWLRSYVSDGGVVVCTPATYSLLTSQSLTERYVSYLSFCNSQWLHRVGIIQLRSNVAFHPSSTQSEPIALVPYGKGLIAFLPFEIETLIDDTRTSYESFPSPHRRRPFERVSTVSKHTVRLLLHSILKYLFHHQSLPYIHSWYFPESAPSVFCFRIDTDGATREQLEDLFVLLHRHHYRASWFVDIESQQEHLPLYKEFEGHDIGVHCFSHQHFNTVHDFQSDLKRACEVMLMHHLPLTGHASPYGDWNDSFDRIVKEAGFEYSSDFSYDYDSIPSVSAAGLLQVPVHPICIGSLKRHSYSSNDMKQYFESVTERKIALNEPLCYYHHPRDGYLDVLEHLFRNIASLKIPHLTLKEYAQWWKQRNSFMFQCTFDQNSLTFTSSSTIPPMLAFHVSHPQKGKLFLKSTGSFQLESLSFHPSKESYRYPPYYFKQTHYNYRIPLVRTTDSIHHFLRRLLNR